MHFLYICHALFLLQTILLSCLVFTADHVIGFLLDHVIGFLLHFERVCKALLIVTTDTKSQSHKVARDGQNGARCSCRARTRDGGGARPRGCKRVFITNVKGTFFGMSESEEASKRR